MKYFITALAAVVLMSQPAEARWHGHHRRHGCCYASDVAVGIVSTTAGIMIANELMHNPASRHHRNRVYIYEPEEKCYTVVSRKTGKVTQECVENSANEVIYVD